MWQWVDPLGLACKETGKAQKIQDVQVLRKDIDFLGKNGDDKYGHWWIEIDGKESYGWWPEKGVGLKDTLFGTKGELNSSFFRGTPTRDPHHGDRGLGVDVYDVFGTKDKSQVVKEIRDFASSYSGKWSWPTGQNCHSFQKEMLKQLDLTAKKVELIPF